jgi:N-acetylglucosamine-6-phosphate deacetylase
VGHDRAVSTTITARVVATPAGLLGDHAVTVTGDAITALGAATGEPEHDVVAPGFIDLQVNGHDDVDVATMDRSQWPRIRELLLAQGVTTWCPTLVTAPRDRYAERLEHLSALAADPATGPAVAGAHLEGPYLGRRHGAHRGVPEGPIDLGWLRDLPEIVRIVTLGPERPNATDAVEGLLDRGIIVALGHTDATYEQATACIDAGASLFTHCYNACGPLHHRDPGALGAALTRDDVSISLIADGVHVHPAMIRLAARAKPPDRVVLVTDAVGWRARRLGGSGVELLDGAPRLTDGTLAGSALRMDRAVRCAAEDAGLGLGASLAAAAANPAALLGLHDRGSIEVGKRADLIAIDASGVVTDTWVGGRHVHSTG